MNTRGIIALSSFAALCGLPFSVFAQVFWQPNITDAFQHQRWGSDATVPGGAAGAGDKFWETPAYFQAAPGRPEFLAAAGWCFPSATVNQLYHFQQKGLGGLTAPVNNVATLHDEIKAFDTAWNAAAGGFTRKINNVLRQRGADPTRVRDGLTAQNFLQDGNNIVYRSADGTNKNLGKGVLYDHIRAVMKRGDSVNMRLGYNGPQGANDPQRDLWWAGGNFFQGSFHEVTVAGYDPAGNGTIYFADPDSNPTNNGATGNTNADAGWVGGGTSVNRPGLIQAWKAAPNQQATKRRRFNEAGAVPKPAGAAPTPAEQAQLYFAGTLANNGKKFSIPANTGSDRYDNVEIRLIDTLQVVKAGNKPIAGRGAVPEFQVTPGAADGGVINQFWLFPATAGEMLVDIPVVAGWNVNILPTNTIDPWGNDRPFGGVYFESLGAGLIGTQTLDFAYQTLSGSDLTAWDFVFNDRNDPSNFGANPTFEALGVQTYGGGFEDLPYLQIPAPGAALSFVMGGLLIGRRRR